MTFRAVLWDFGGVLSTSPFEAFARYEEERGLPAGLLRRLNATNPDANAWARFERAELDIEGFCKAYEEEAALEGHTLDALEVLACLTGDLRPRMLDAVRACRASGLRTGCLTNNMSHFAEGGTWKQLVPFDELFDVLLESSKIGLRKPDPAIYELACRELEVEPAEVVFLDDLGVNLKPARAMGMTTIKVVDPDEALAELSSLLDLAMSRR